jgi:hypothetical protein
MFLKNDLACINILCKSVGGTRDGQVLQTWKWPFAYRYAHLFGGTLKLQRDATWFNFASLSLSISITQFLFAFLPTQFSLIRAPSERALMHHEVADYGQILPLGALYSQARAQSTVRCDI